LKPGDLITKVDDTSMKGLSLNEAVKRMRGEPRTKVLLTIYRKDENRTFPVTIIREEIKTVSVKSKMIENGYGWIRVSQFQERTVDDLARKLEELYKQDPKMKGLVLDLRNDPDTQRKMQELGHAPVTLQAGKSKASARITMSGSAASNS
jgi:carboxyl-terminal processing protease